MNNKKLEVVVVQFEILAWHLSGNTVEYHQSYEGWNFNSGNYLFTTDTK